MPTKQQKHVALDGLKDSLSKATVALVTDYRGLTVAEITDLRRRIQKAGGDFTSREQLLAKLMGSLNAPATGMVMTTAGVARKLVYALEARRKQLAG